MTQTFDVISATELLAQTPIGGTFIIPGMLREGSLMFVFGPAKHLKSFLLQDMAIALVTGEPFLGMPIDRARRVLYVQRESPAWALQQRFERLIGGRGLQPNALQNLSIITNQKLMLDDGASMDALHTAIATFKPDVLVIDPLAQAHRQNENDTTDMIAICDVLLRLRDSHDQTLLISHHMNRTALSGKPGLRKESMIRGNHALWASADGGWFITPRRREHVKDIEVELKEGGAADPFCFAIRDLDDNGQHHIIVEPTLPPTKTVRLNRHAIRSDEQAKIVATIAAAGREMTFAEMRASHPDVPERRLRDLLALAVDANEITRRSGAKNAAIYSTLSPQASP